MLKDVLFDNYKLKQDSIFDLGELYKSIFRWFDVNGYSFYEKEYNDIDEPGGKHLEIYWYTEKKIDLYVKFVIEVSYLVLNMQKIELEKGGVKIKTNKGSIEFRITAYLMKDYDDKWSKSAMQKKMRYVYDRFIIKKRIDKLEVELVKDVNSLIDELKSFLDIHKF